jgi:response regulator RpfG family c-di-GMP phosphodiesterase
MLPRLSGGELLRRVRRTCGTLPVLVLTARDATDDKVKHFEAGADDYLTKPFDFAELVVRVRALLRRTPAEHNDVLRIDDLELHRLTQRVYRGGQRIDLTAKEYSLLEYLMSSMGPEFPGGHQHRGRVRALSAPQDRPAIPGGADSYGARRRLLRAGSRSDARPWPGMNRLAIRA